MIRATEYFSIIPEAVLDADISDGAYRLYGAIARIVDFDTKRGYVRIKTLAGRLRKEERTIQRNLKQLVDAKLVSVQHQYTDDRGNYGPVKHKGWRQTVSIYTLLNVTGEGDNNVAGEGVADVALSNTHTPQEFYDPDSPPPF